MEFISSLNKTTLVFRKALVTYFKEKQGYKEIGSKENTFLKFFLFCIVRIYPPFTRKQITLLYSGRDVRIGLGVAISEVSGPSVFHIKMGASR